MPITSLAMPDNNLILQFANQAPQIGAAFDQALAASRQQQLQRYQLGVQLQQAQQVQAAKQAYIANPNAQNLNALITLDPKSAEAIKSGHEALDLDTQKAQLRQATYIRGLISSGKPDQAAAALQQRISADAAAGQDTTDDQHMLDLINADPKQAGAAIDYHLASILGPEKFSDNFKALGSESRDNAELPGKMALTAAQTAASTASARKDGFLVVPNSEGGSDVLNISGATGGAPGAPAAAGAAPTGPATIPGPAGQAVAAAAAKVGATPADMDYLARTAALESGGRPGAQNGSSTGVFQMQPKTFAGLGGTDINDVGQQTTATLKNAAQNAKTMTGMLGRQPTAAEVYLGHQQGATGASALIANPDQNAIQALIGAGVPPAKAKASIMRNGGTADMTAGQFVQKWGDAYAKAGGAPADAAGDEQPQLGPGVSVAYKAAGSSENRLTPEAIDYVAQQYIATGQLPPLGMGKTATANRNAVLNRAQQIEAETGATGYDAVARHATMKTAQATMTMAQKKLSDLSAAEDTVKGSMDIVTKLANRGAAGPTPARVLNMPIQLFRKNFVGSGDVASLDNALGTTADDYSRVMTRGGQNSEGARNEAYQRLHNASSVGQLMSIMSTMRQEMAQARAAQQNQVTEQLAILGNHGAAPQAAPPPAPPQPNQAPVQVKSVQQAMALPPGTVFITPDGRKKVR